MSKRPDELDEGLAELRLAGLDPHERTSHWYEPTNILAWTFGGGVVAGIVAGILGPTSDVGSYFFLFALLMGIVALLALVAVLATYVRGALTAFHATDEPAAQAMRLAERIGEVPSLRRAAWRYALGSRGSPRWRFGRLSSGGISMGGFLVLMFVVLGALTVHQASLIAPINAYANARTCSFGDVMVPTADCHWAGNATVIQRLTHSTWSHTIWLRLPDGTEKLADLGTQDLPYAKRGDVVGSHIWRGHVTEVDGYGWYVWTAMNPAQQRINTWEWMAAVMVLILLAVADVFYRYRRAFGGALAERAA